MINEFFSYWATEIWKLSVTAASIACSGGGFVTNLCLTLCAPGQWPLAWVGRGRAVGLRVRHGHPRVPKSSGHQDAMTLFLAAGLVGEVFSHVIVLVRDEAWRTFEKTLMLGKTERERRRG